MAKEPMMKDGASEAKEKFISRVAGVKFRNDTTEVVITNDGRIVDDHKGDNVVGFREWEGKYSCRSISIGDRDIPDDCRVVILKDGVLTFVRNKG